MGGYSGSNMFGLNFSYRDFIVQLISRFVKNQHIAIALVSHVYGDENPESDARGEHESL